MPKPHKIEPEPELFELVSRDTVLLSGQGALTEADRVVRDPAPDELVSLPEAEARAMARRAQRAYDGFERLAVRGMSRERAEQIRVWRVVLKCSWRKIAELAFPGWGQRWSPPWNQLAGLALCRRAAVVLGEDGLRPPWNAAGNGDG